LGSGTVSLGALLLQFIRSARADAFLWAIASIETMGLTPEAEGNVEPSMAYRLRASQTSPSGLMAEVFADDDEEFDGEDLVEEDDEEEEL
jgi:hypothetical protein